MFYRSPFYRVSGDDGASWFRFLPGTQDGWHVISGPACVAADLKATGPIFDSLELSDAIRGLPSDGTYGVEFARIPFACP